MIPWHKLDGRRRDALKLIIQRAQRPSDMSVPFFRVSLPTFGNVSRATIFFTNISYRDYFTDFESRGLLHNPFEHILEAINSQCLHCQPVYFTIHLISITIKQIKMSTLNLL